MRSLNKKLLAYYLTYQFIPKPLPRERGAVRGTSLYAFPKKHDPRHDLATGGQEIARGLHATLDSIVRSTLKTTRQPIGLLLSGGMDSTILLHLLRQHTDRKILTISGAYDADATHLKIGALLAKKYNTIHQELILTPDRLPELGKLYAKGLPAPIGDNGFLATALMCRALAAKTKVIYAGDGADCLFQGLSAHRLHAAERQGASPRSSQESDYAHYKYDEIFFTAQDAADHLGSHDSLAAPLQRTQRSIHAADPVKHTILLDLNFLAANRVDYILSAAPDSRTRIILPFLDPALIKYALRIPSRYFIHDGIQKYILKQAFRGIIPAAIITRPKQGLTPPFLRWYAANRAFVSTTLQNAAVLGISPGYIDRLIRSIDHSNRYTTGMRIWLTLNLVLWHDGHATPKP